MDGAVLVAAFLKPPGPVEFIYPEEALKGGLQIVAVVQGMKKSAPVTCGLRTSGEVAAFQRGIAWPLLEKTPSVRVVLTSRESVIKWSNLSVTIEKIAVEVLIAKALRFEEEFSTEGEAEAFIKGISLLCELHNILFSHDETEIVRAA